MVRSGSVDVDVRRAEKEDLNGVWEIIDSCAKSLSEQGYNHWKEYYTRELIEKLVAEKEVYLFDEVGTITLGVELPHYYSEEDRSKFTDPKSLGLCIMALGVKPAEQGKGIAGKLIDFAVEEAKKRGVNWLRIDCREIPSLVRFYVNRGFKEVGRMYEGDNKEEVYLLMERVV